MGFTKFQIKKTGSTLILLILVFLSGCSIYQTKANAIDVTDRLSGYTGRKLTLLVYMAADNDLESYALENIKAMERAVFRNINVLALLDRSDGYDETDGNWTDTRLFEVLHDNTDGSFMVSRRLDCPELGLSAQNSTELDMSNYHVLQNFISYAKKNYKAQNYALIIWGHGTGWRFSQESARAVALDDKSGSYMTITQMGKALKDQGLSVIGFDTCFAGVFECIYQINCSAQYTVASPGITPSAGWNYKQLLEKLDSDSFDSLTIAKYMAQSSLVNATVFDNSQVENVFADLEDFSKSLSQTIVDEQSRAVAFEQLMNLKAYSYTQYPCDKYLDIYSLADFYSLSAEQELSEKAENMKCSIGKLCPDSHGVGLHFIPMVSAGMAATCHSKDYVKDFERTDQCAFVQKSLWWVPSKDTASDSLLNKLFYKTY